jgi:hypothetical protein
MDKVFVLNKQTRLPSLVDSLQNGLIDGYNAVADAGILKEHNAYTMVGYLAASIIALKCAGNFKLAQSFDQTAQKISVNWKVFQTEVQNLNEIINKLEQ